MVADQENAESSELYEAMTEEAWGKYSKSMKM